MKAVKQASKMQACIQTRSKKASIQIATMHANAKATNWQESLHLQSKK